MHNITSIPTTQKAQYVSPYKEVTKNGMTSSYCNGELIQLSETRPDGTKYRVHLNMGYDGGLTESSKYPNGDVFECVANKNGKTRFLSATENGKSFQVFENNGKLIFEEWSDLAKQFIRKVK